MHLRVYWNVNIAIKIHPSHKLLKMPHFALWVNGCIKYNSSFYLIVEVVFWTILAGFMSNKLYKITERRAKKTHEYVKTFRAATQASMWLLPNALKQISKVFILHDLINSCLNTTQYSCWLARPDDYFFIIWSTTLRIQGLSEQAFFIFQTTRFEMYV